MAELSTHTEAPASLAGKYLTFAISQERYGLEIVKVQEIIGLTHITTVPGCPASVRGVINLRGKIIPVFDLRTKFGIESIPPDDKMCIIVVNINRTGKSVPVGVLVDTVLEVIGFRDDEIEAAPTYGELLPSQFVIGMGKKDGLLNILIDIDKIITVTDSTALATIASGA